MWRVGGLKVFLIATAIDLAAFVIALIAGAPFVYALIGLGVVAFAEFVVATM